VAPEVGDFYEQTSDYELDAWSEWHGLFSHLGRSCGDLQPAAAAVEYSFVAMDSSKGMTSHVLQLRAGDGRAGADGVGSRAARDRECDLCGKLFGLPRSGFRLAVRQGGVSAAEWKPMVIMKPESHEDGSFLLLRREVGLAIRDFTSRFMARRAVWARSVRTFKEKITVYGRGRNGAGGP